MNKGKKIWIALFLALALMVILSGCSGLPKTAKLNISIYPNPVPCSSEDGKWHITMIISESNGVGVTLASVRFDSYDQTEQLYHTQFLYEEDIIDWFESNYIPAFSMLQDSILWSTSRKYIAVTIEGVDDNENPIEATGRIDFLPQ
jgi:hypothetical protein